MDGKTYELSPEGFQSCQTDFPAIDFFCPHGCRIIGGNRKISDLFSIHGDQNIIVAPVGNVAKYLSRQDLAAMPEDTEVRRRSGLPIQGLHALLIGQPLVLQEHQR